MYIVAYLRQVLNGTFISSWGRTAWWWLCFTATLASWKPQFCTAVQRITNHRPWLEHSQPCQLLIFVVETSQLES
jgi:hypothetical protein